MIDFKIFKILGQLEGAQNMLKSQMEKGGKIRLEGLIEIIQETIEFLDKESQKLVK